MEPSITTASYGDQSHIPLSNTKLLTLKERLPAFQSIDIDYMSLADMEAESSVWGCMRAFNEHITPSTVEA